MKPETLMPDMDVFMKIGPPMFAALIVVYHVWLDPPSERLARGKPANDAAAKERPRRSCGTR